MYIFGAESHINAIAQAFASNLISLAVELSGKAHEQSDCTAMNAILH